MELGLGVTSLLLSIVVVIEREIDALYPDVADDTYVQLPAATLGHHFRTYRGSCLAALSLLRQKAHIRRSVGDRPETKIYLGIEHLYIIYKCSEEKYEEVNHNKHGQIFNV